MTTRYDDGWKGVIVWVPGDRGRELVVRHTPAGREQLISDLQQTIDELRSDACLFPEERAARDAAFNMQGVPKP